MRGVVLVIALFLLAGAVALSMWPWFFGHGGIAAGADAPAGQYPIGWDRPEWSATERTRAFGPSASMGSNTVVPNGVDAAAPKVICATASTCPADLSFGA